MVNPRRAEARGASASLAAGIRAAVVTLGLGLTGVLALLGVLSVRIARKVVTPAHRVPDTKIVSLDTAAQTITLSRTPDTALPGRYGLFTDGTASYVKLGSVLAQDGDTVKRKLLTHIGVGASISSEAAFSGWYYAGPEELQLPVHPRAHRLRRGSVPGVALPGRRRQATSG